MSWIPSETGDFPITITVTDGNGKETTQSFILTAIASPIVAAPPTFSSKPTGPAYLGETWNYKVTASATDGGNVKYYLMTSSGDMIREIVDGNLAEVWDAEGMQSLIIRAVDVKNDVWAEQRFSIQVVQRVVETNSPPVILSIPVEEMSLGELYQYRVVAYDPNGDPITYSLAQAPLGASISQDGLISWTPSQKGDYSFTILVWDGNDENAPVEQTFTLKVHAPVTLNRPPQITSIPIGPAMKDRLYEYQATAIDLDGDEITWFATRTVARRGSSTMRLEIKSREPFRSVSVPTASRELRTTKSFRKETLPNGASTTTTVACSCRFRSKASLRLSPTTAGDASTRNSSGRI